jgi:hypothetical protein
LLLAVAALGNLDAAIRYLVAVVRYLIASLCVVEDDVSADMRLACLAALSNLSTNLEHVWAVATSGAVRAMIALSLDDTMSEVALGVLADLAAASAAARKEMAEDEAAPRALVEAVARHGSARCQEHATYLVMALAHGGGHAEQELMQWVRRIGAV